MRQRQGDSQQEEEEKKKKSRKKKKKEEKKKKKKKLLLLREEDLSIGSRSRWRVYICSGFDSSSSSGEESCWKEMCPAGFCLREQRHLFVPLQRSSSSNEEGFLLQKQTSSVVEYSARHLQIAATRTRMRPAAAGLLLQQRRVEEGGGAAASNMRRSNCSSQEKKQQQQGKESAADVVFTQHEFPER